MDKIEKRICLYSALLMKSKLQLDTVQILKVKAVNLKYAQLFEPIIKGDDSRFTKFKKAKDLQKQKDKELKGIFTKDQFKKYQDFESEMKSKMMSKANM